MSESKKLNVTRRSFLLGGTAALIGAGATASLTGCNRKKGGDASNTGGEINATFAYQAPQINPVGNTTVLGRSTFWHICEGLYNIDVHTFKTYNGLAALSPRKINDYTYDVTLRDNAKFSNGEDVKPEDVVNSFKMNMQNETFNALLGFIKDVIARDSKTVTFELNFPFENLLEQRLACVFIWPASQSEAEYKSKPIGSGPWVLKSFDGTNGGKVEFEPNPHYEGKFAATAEKMTWNVLLDNVSRITAITDRTTQAIEAVPELSAGQVRSSGATVEFEQGFGCAYLMFNCLKEPFNDPKVRQAFHYAINYDSLIDVQLDGHATAATSFLPKNHPNYHRASNVYDYDPEKAKSLLKEAGVDSISCKLTVDTNWVKVLGPQVQSDLNAAGINTELDTQTINWANYTDTTGILPYDVILAPGDPTMIGNDVDLLMSFWYGDNVWMNSRTCWKRSNGEKWRELNGLLQQARESSSSSTQQSLWNQCFDIIAANCPILPLFHREVGTGFLQDQLENFRPISTTGLVFLGASVKQ